MRIERGEGNGAELGPKRQRISAYSLGQFRLLLVWVTSKPCVIPKHLVGNGCIKSHIYISQ